MARDVQTEILAKLYGAPGLRYSEAHPEDVENDLYNYHLQSLVKKGLIEKKDQIYSLTFDGLQHIVKNKPINLSGTKADLFKVNVLTLVLKEEKNTKYIVNQRRKMHPFYGDQAVLGGMVKNGEPIVSAASRKLQEESGLIADFSLVGVIRGVFIHEGEILQDILFHVCVAEEFTGELVSENEFGSNFWVTLDQAIESEHHSRAALLPLIELYRQLKANTVSQIPFFYFDLELKVDHL